MTPAGEQVTLEALAARLLDVRQTAPLVVGITGPVAVGKTVLARQLAERLPGAVERISTDGFLKPNAALEAEGLVLRKGFPESYDRAAMAAALAGLKRGPVRVPGYSHALYDVDPAAARTIAGADVVLVEGLGLGSEGVRPAVDVLLYLDAAEADVLEWFRARFMTLRAAAADDPASFYARFLGMSEAEALSFADAVWDGINRPNWLEHISRARAVADLVLWKSAGHGLALVMDRLDAGSGRLR
jgi:type I pantothenate kinase